MGYLLSILLSGIILSAGTFSADSLLLDAYRHEDMPVWKEYIDQRPQRPASPDRVQTDLLIEYGYCGYLVDRDKEHARPYVEQFKQHVEETKESLPTGHYEMYRSAVLVYELRLHMSMHPISAMNLAKQATKLAPEDPLVLSYYATSLFYAPSPFGNKRDALAWFTKAERLFRSPEWRFCWVRDATYMYIQQCNEKLDRTPVAAHQSQCLLVPDDEMPANGWPAILLLHDHGARFEKGWEKVIGANTEPYYNGIAIGDSLAAHGYVVYCIDALYWGSRRSTLTQRQFSDSLGGAGEWYARVLDEDRKSIRYLCSLPFVDSTRIAAAGFSYGAYRAWNMAAEEPRVSVCIAAHWMTTLAQNRYNDSWLCMCRKEQRPFEEIAAEICPRPFLLQYGTKDRLFPLSAVDSCVTYIDSVYQQKPVAAGSFRAEQYDCDHVFTHNHLQNWLLWLKKHL